MSVASTSADPWDHPFPVAVAQRRPIAAQAVRDDWDDDDEEEEDQQQVWADANKTTPMPELVISGSSTTSMAPPPAAAFQPALRILKRPTAFQTSSLSSATAATDAQKTYAEREAQYVAARDRIFKERVQNRTAEKAADDGNRGSKGDGGAASPPGQAAAAKVVRNLRGPTGDAGNGPHPAGGQPRGFVSRKGTRSAQGQLGPGEKLA